VRHQQLPLEHVVDESIVRQRLVLRQAEVRLALDVHVSGLDRPGILWPMLLWPMLVLVVSGVTSVANERGTQRRVLRRVRRRGTAGLRV